MDNLAKENIGKVCKELRSAFNGILSWQWDERFETVLAEFPVNDKDKVRTILELYFSTVWSNSNINKAPDTVLALIKYLAGFASEQLLFTSDTNQDIFIFCAWWPWGNGQTISARIAPFSTKLSDSEKTELIQPLKEWFGIHQDPDSQKNKEIPKND